MKNKIIISGYIFFFLGLFLLECSNFFVNVIFLSNYLKILKFISLFILAFSGVMISIKAKSLNPKKIFIILCLLIICLISYYKTRSTMFLEFLVVSINIIEMDFNKVIKYDLIIKLFIIAFIVTMNHFGYANSEFVVTRDGEFLRNAYGFYHPNTFGMIIMICFFEYIYLRGIRINIKDYILALLIILIIKVTSDTRTVIYCIIALMALILLVKRFKINNKILNIIKNNLYLILLAASLIVTFLYVNHNSFAISLNHILSNRLNLQSYFFNLYNINLFGNNIDFVQTLDNGFIKIILNYGIFTTIFLAILYNLNFKKCTKNRQPILMLIFIVILFFSLSESFMFYVYNNIFLCYIFSKSEGVKEIESQNINNNTSI